MNGDNVLSLILNAGPVVKLVMLILLFFSVYSWAIIIYKHRFFSKVEKDSAKFYRIFTQGRDWESINKGTASISMSPIANVFRAAFSAGKRSSEDMRRSLKRAEIVEAVRLEKYLTFLATTGSTTPFIGLFGTVWGIMNSFHGIGKIGSASLAVVAPGIAEALIATAAGLVAAIPAVIAYNYFLSRANRNIIMMEDFSQELLEQISEHDDDEARQTRSV
ncbi:MAG: protein TolQ [Nitrospirae bacterium]|nr:protein TolQ [Nitrospirota bacterium]